MTLNQRVIISIKTQHLKGKMNKENDIRVKAVVSTYKTNPNTQQGEYEIEVSKGDSEWIVRRTYAEFTSFNKKIKSKFSDIPSLPKRTLFKTKSDEKIQKRCKKINDYIADLSSRIGLYGNQDFLEFLEINQNKEKVGQISSLGLVGMRTHASFGYRDIVLLPQHKLMFGLVTYNGANEKGIFSKNKKKRMDNEGNTIHTGDLECLSEKKQDEEEVHNYELLWHVNFKERGSCLHWDNSAYIILMGCEKGSILGLKVVPKTALKYLQFIDIKCHSDKVMGIYVDPERCLMFSASEDRYLVVTDLKLKQPYCSKLMWS